MKISADRWDLNGETTELHFYDEVHNISMTISSTLSQLNKGVDAQTGHPWRITKFRHWWTLFSDQIWDRHTQNVIDERISSSDDTLVLPDSIPVAI